MGARLYVGNLSVNTGEADLRELFEQNDWKVEGVRLVADHETGRMRGFGFVEMGSNEHAQQAISQLDGFELDGRNLKVNEAPDRNSRSDRADT